MELTQARKDTSMCFSTENEEAEHPFLPPAPTSNSPSSSSPFLLNWTDAPEPSPSSTSEPPASVEKEHMFEKVVTPSDVGKLNRLVIPKQHAEKYFPLDSSSHDKGLLLNFEDRNGKPWRFRYSYWNSSQSYVMTKGWSRFVKEKRLDAGDTVSFGRGVGEATRDRLFIDWKRRPDPHFDPSSASLRIPRFAYHPTGSHHPYNLPFPARSSTVPWATSRLFAPSLATNYLYFRSPQPAQQPDRARHIPMVLDSFPVGQAKTPGPTKRVRLFGVNLEPARDAAGDHDTDGPAGLLQLQLRAPLPPSELQLGGGVRSSSSSSSSRGEKDGLIINSPSLDLDM